MLKLMHNYGGPSFVASMVGLALLLSACQPLVMPDNGDVSGETDVEAADQAAFTEEQAVLVSRAVEDLATVVGAASAEIQVSALEEVMWPDSSLGCPQPDMVYAQVLTPGFRITLEHAGAAYTYHTSENPAGPVTLCEAAQ